MNASHIILLWYSSTLMPHYTVAFKPIFEFIILGIIPGTNVQIDMSGTLVIVITALTALYIAVHQSSKKHQETFSSIYDICL